MASSSDSPSVVKKLLFPAFDAGRNHSFYETTAAATSVKSGKAFSEASTQLHNNLSRIPKWQNRHDKVTTTAAAAEVVVRRPDQGFGMPDVKPEEPDSMPNETVLPMKHWLPPSPPKLRMQRNVSTTAVASDRLLSRAVKEAKPAETDLNEQEEDLVEDEIITDDSTGSAAAGSVAIAVIAVAAPAVAAPAEANIQNIRLEASALAGRRPEDADDPAEPVWEEEATPMQTAFARKVMFQHRTEESSETGSSDFTSTASEMGTVIHTDRLADLNGMEEPGMFDIDDELEGRPEAVPPSVGGSPPESPKAPAANKFYSDPDPVWEKDVLSLPKLEGRLVGIASFDDNHKVQDTKEDVGTGDRMDEPAVDSNMHRLSMAIRRISSGLATRPRTTAILSAPNTPLGSTKSRKAVGCEAFSTLSLTEAPSSFLLRSPGSFMPTEPIRSKPTYHEGSIPEDKEAPQDQEVAASLLPMHHVAPNPFQIARSCFSFDAYDTSMDDDVEYRVKSVTAHQLYAARHQDWVAEEALKVPQSMSWDAGGSSAFRSAFRPTHGHAFAASPSNSPGKRAGRTRLMCDTYSPPSDATAAVELKTPQRIEIEREDAIDILTCLVERGVTSDIPEPLEEGTRQASPCRAERTEIETSQTLDVLLVVAELKEMCQQSDGKLEENDSKIQQRMKALDELSRSHEYAMEMRRAAKSASSWLKSIGRTHADEKGSLDVFGLSDEKLHRLSDKESFSDRAELVSLKAQLHSAQLELEDKARSAESMNEELAKCRAEIGRLASAAHGERFKSPNCSIMDASLDDDDEADADVVKVTNTSPSQSDKESEFLNTSFPQTSALPLMNDESEHDDIAKMRGALENANEIIRVLHANLKSNGVTDIPEEAPVVEASVAWTASKAGSPGNVDERAVNARMLDAENFETDWDDLVPSLPPPPDHPLRSPIVEAILGQWNEDGTLHESLLSWVETVLSGADPESLNPLTITNLSHQMRDGFTMHVLPLLLQRPDVRVEIKTRVKRETTYDLSVSIESLAPSLGLDFRRLKAATAMSDVGTGSVTHSTATMIMTNGRYLSDPVLAPQTGRPFFNDEFPDEAAGGYAQQPSLISALGGALGGLLSRRKPPSNQVGISPQHEEQESAAFDSPIMTGGLDLVPSEDYDQPYHRVVSAPPGRIGVTFVEFRGHAMVSDVAPESSLTGWIFASDILIAIDELPVSGMRIRDIIKVLKDRSDRQRALRVISSHAMNEFTLSSSVVNEE